MANLVWKYELDTIDFVYYSQSLYVGIIVFSGFLA